MNKTIIYTDSCSSVPEKYQAMNSVYVIPTTFTLNGQDYNPLKCEFSKTEFYNKIEDNSCEVKTSCVVPQTFIDHFKPHLDNKDNIVYIALSSGLSASCNNAKTAVNMLKEEYPDQQIEVVDTLTGSMGMMFAIREAVKLRNEGFSPVEIKSALDNNKLNVQALFTIGSLYHLYKGGRLNIGVATVGRLLRLKPIVATNEKGSLVSHSIHMGKKKSNAAMKDLVIAEKLPSSNRVVIAYTNNPDEADKLEEELKAAFPEIKIEKDQIDYTMGCHCGPQALAVFYRKK